MLVVGRPSVAWQASVAFEVAASVDPPRYLDCGLTIKISPIQKGVLAVARENTTHPLRFRIFFQRGVIHAAFARLQFVPQFCIDPRRSKIQIAS